MVLHLRGGIGVAAKCFAVPLRALNFGTTASKHQRSQMNEHDENCRAKSAAQTSASIRSVRRPWALSGDIKRLPGDVAS